MGRQAISTGGAGFIGSHRPGRLLAEGGWKVTVVDHFTPNYPRAIKEEGLAPHLLNPAFTLVEAAILDRERMEPLFSLHPAADTVVLHLAALVGVRPSVTDP